MTSRGPQPAAPARTERQQARRRRILDVSTELAAAGGFEAVQMREVAESAQVALGTLYRYFPSKIHLLLGVLHDQLEQLHATLRERPLTERDPAERLVRTLKRAFRSHQREPRLAEAMMRALQFADGSARAEVGAVSRLTSTLLMDASGLTGPEAEAHMSAVRVIQHTWHSSLLYWLSGNTTLAEAHADIETACRLMSRAPSPPS
ncbi:TetR family transcriptional regulator [Streptomyces litchfieldiae]|uniref:TetR family transcriptional regulator n=1 Tax=Streptomyces litchfieldiae TaxID=3075543 RepID=A0ABU2MXC6_9ACTN|nr:TetR family transcriptional regulator [Streptomyces sp. DSM 44938]MDT0346312.1 TetR family transcriptional regulator [Streptomyces sp. DSM 44938]